MEEIDFAECSGSNILAFLIVLYDAYVNVKATEEIYDGVREERFEFEQKLICLERKLTCKEKTALEIERLNRDYFKIIDREYFAKMDLINRRNFFNCALKKYKGLIDEKYIYDGTLSKVIDVFMADENVNTVKQALKILKNI